MENWGWALLLKPIAGVFVLLGLWLVFLLARVLMLGLRRIFPGGKLKAALFDDGRGGGTSQPASAGKGNFQSPPIAGRKPLQDVSSLLGIGKDH